MTDLRKAAEMGLEALEANLGKWAAKTPAIEALRQALAQTEWVGLTLDEMHQLNDALNLQGRFSIIETIEAKLKEKNT